MIMIEIIISSLIQSTIITSYDHRDNIDIKQILNSDNRSNHPKILIHVSLQGEKVLASDIFLAFITPALNGVNTVIFPIIRRFYWKKGLSERFYSFKRDLEFRMLPFLRSNRDEHSSDTSWQIQLMQGLLCTINSCQSH